MIEGGAEVTTSVLQPGVVELVDSIILTVAPMFVGESVVLYLWNGMLDVIKGYRWTQLLAEAAAWRAERERLSGVQEVVD